MTTNSTIALASIRAQANAWKILITREIIDTWRKQVSESASQKCYVITRDAVRYGDRPGIDPSTGRQCRKVTDELIERLREYEKGQSPEEG